jgi:protease-4
MILINLKRNGMKRRTRRLIGLSIVTFIGLGITLMFTDIDPLAASNRVGVIEVQGTISDAKDFIKNIKELREDDRVRCILIRIDSPGGGVGPSQEMYREIERTIEEKPVVASLGSIAASGGYYIAAPTSHIVANPGTVTGSIGVISYFPNLQQIFDKIGYSMVIIKSGQYKDIGNPARQMTSEEVALLQATINETYAQFVRDVAKGRKLSEEKVREFADGRIFTGEAALRLGLVDTLGNFEDAVLKAASLGKIEGKPEVIVVKKKKRSLLDLFLGEDVSSRLSQFLNGPTNMLRYQVPFSL